MKGILLLITLIITSVMAQAQDRIYITVNGATRSIILSDSEAAKELGNRVRNGNITVKMSDYGGFEKVGELPWSLPTSNRQISTSPGDVMLYLGNNIVIFYGTNSWSYTPLGKIEDMTAEEIRDFLAGGNIDATLSADAISGISGVNADSSGELTIYTLQGVKIDMSGRTLEELPVGSYNINGKMYLVR